MIRITIERKGKAVKVTEFDDINKAGTWLVEDSYISNPDVTKVTWENVPGAVCDHGWLYRASVVEYFWVECHYCGKGIRFDQDDLTALAKTKGQLP